MKTPLSKILPLSPEGSFGARRKFDYHTGVDLYCENESPVFAIEDGIVEKNAPFTGSQADSPWWEDTDYVGIWGSKFIVYGEITTHLKIGDVVKAGDEIGRVKRVLKTDKGRPMSMLHLEVYSKVMEPVWWKADEAQPDGLLNPQEIFDFLKIP